MRWKLLGLAGLAGVAAGGAVVARRRREHRDYDPEELRERLRRRLADAESAGDAPADASERPPP
jgi:LPXTG-motif cell wall-anchored protein